MTGEELLKVLQSLPEDDLKREVVLPVQHSTTACQKVLKMRMGGVDSLRSNEAIDALFLGDYLNLHPAIVANCQVLIHKGREGVTFK